MAMQEAESKTVSRLHDLLEIPPLCQEKLSLLIRPGSFRLHLFRQGFELNIFIKQNHSPAPRLSFAFASLRTFHCQRRTIDMHGHLQAYFVLKRHAPLLCLFTGSLLISGSRAIIAAGC